jgi:tetratricopeptide (TPR) repeat protein
MSSLELTIKFNRTAPICLVMSLILCCGCALSQITARAETNESINSERVSRDRATATLTESDKRPFWSPKDPDPKTTAGASFRKAYKLQKEGNFDIAVQTYKKAVLQNPKLTSAYYNMGLCFESQSKWADAEASFKNVIELARLMPEGYKHLAFVCFKQGKEADGRAYIRRFLSL